MVGFTFPCIIRSICYQLVNCAHIFYKSIASYITLGLFLILALIAYLCPMTLNKLIKETMESKDMNEEIKQSIFLMIQGAMQYIVSDVFLEQRLSSSIKVKIYMM